MKNISETKAYKISFVGVFSALAVGLSFFESVLPAFAFMPPGAKVGLSNVAVMFATVFYGIPAGFFVAAVKSLFVFLTSGATAFFMSLSGGLLSTVIMFIFFRYTKLGYIEIGIFSAIAHNLGQLLCALAVVGSKSVLGYVPVMAAASVAAGAATGAILSVVMPKLLKSLKKSVREDAEEE